MTGLSSVLSDLGRLFQVICIACFAFLIILGSTRGDEAVMTLLLLSGVASLLLGVVLRALGRLAGRERTRA
jgi:hypothetical protein